MLCRYTLDELVKDVGLPVSVRLLTSHDGITSSSARIRCPIDG